MSTVIAISFFFWIEVITREEDSFLERTELCGWENYKRMRSGWDAKRQKIDQSWRACAQMYVESIIQSLVRRCIRLFALYFKFSNPLSHDNIIILFIIICYHTHDSIPIRFLWFDLFLIVSAPFFLLLFAYLVVPVRTVVVQLCGWRMVGTVWYLIPYSISFTVGMYF